jgi:hypothetical protein
MIVIAVMTVISVVMRMSLAHGFPPRAIVLLYAGLAYFSPERFREN